LTGLIVNFCIPDLPGGVYCLDRSLPKQLQDAALLIIVKKQEEKIK